MKFRIYRQAPKPSNRGRYGKQLAEVNKRKAQEFAEKVRPILLDIMSNARIKDARNPRWLAEKLNAMGIPSAHGGKWSRETVRRLLKRLAPEFLREFNQLRDRKVK